ncbi:L-threonine 3-dehydrogenase, mitochondrial [Smittium culicis]|uniref:L-threonine 3-dehydrogenase, mitochondrial n=1 Tax=Smittium culicis TaxID=133412 RepID=A0A1R1Y6D1_9FUNG|nr:L-threonine 3-dehydrogenase, mitochondrial [Smittium culicis]
MSFLSRAFPLLKSSQATLSIPIPTHILTPYLPKTLSSSTTSIISRSISSLKHSNTLPANNRPFSSTKNDYKVLITGGCGQLGIAVADNLRASLGKNNVIITDIKTPSDSILSNGPFEHLDVLDKDGIKRIATTHNIDCIIHFSVVLSALGEINPKLALDVNLNGFQNILDISKELNLRLMCPSTMGVFGPTTPQNDTPDLTIMRPNTIYGITKVHMELMGEYYAQKYNLDFRSIRYPGIISASLPGGGTTDYAVDIFHAAKRENKFTCFLEKDTRLAMMYLDDCIDATVKLLFHPSEQLSQNVYNISSISFTPSELAAEIKSQFSNDFQITYKPDYRQKIAETWPFSLNSDNAIRDWGFNPKITTVKDLVSTMFTQLSLNNY